MRVFAIRSTSDVYSSSGFSPYESRSVSVIVNDARGAQGVASVSVIVENYTDCPDPDNCYVTSKRKPLLARPGLQRPGRR